MTCVVDAAAYKDWMIQWNSGQIELPWVPFVFCDSKNFIELSLPEGFKRFVIPENAMIVRKSGPDSDHASEDQCFSEEFRQCVRHGGILYIPESPVCWLKLILCGEDSLALSALKTWIKKRHQWRLGRGDLDLSVPRIMGIWNVDPNSFSSGCEPDNAASIEHAMRLVKDGADILDVGAESTRPGAEGVSVEEEIRRLSMALPPLSGIKIPVSLDSRHGETIRYFLEKSMIDIVNDIGGIAPIDLNREFAIYRDVIDYHAGLVIMAWFPHDSAFQSYDECILQIISQLSEKIELFFYLGGDLRSLVVDPGIGFGKGLDNDFRLIFEASEALMCLGCPVLIAHSRKRCLAKAFNLSTDQLDLPTAMTAAISVRRGASVIRVHSVNTTRMALKCFELSSQFSGVVNE